ncbi:unnamed protein product [Paramecium sonneborni]|uniref:Uncharacterized protein n=1 Tax=Paramecium sonneborni TaxID=65129 RepID=A0A8S1K9Y2_9CILI|nr:unnamed protein product [Paramecium sonneborni]
MTYFSEFNNYCVLVFSHKCPLLIIVLAREIIGIYKELFHAIEEQRLKKQEKN